MSVYEDMVQALNQQRSSVEFDSRLAELVEPPPTPRLANNPRQRLAQRVQAAREQGQGVISVAVEDLEAVLRGGE